jgi:hypothetical protein
VRPVRGLHFGQVDAAAPGRVDVEQRCAREQPADRLPGRGKQIHAGHQSVDQIDERLAIGHVSGAVDQRVLAGEEIGGHSGAEVAGVNGHSFPDFRRQSGRRANEHGNVVVGGERLAQDVATERPGRAQNEEAAHSGRPLQRRGHRPNGRSPADHGGPPA